ncbi:MAG: glucose-6-phosphate isomerase, partial [Patescibacteria group bacterium]
PEEISQISADIDWRRTAINIVSKSGGTIESMSTFLFLREQLIGKVGRKNHATHIIATTDRKQGVLRAIADREGYVTLPVPDDIGGRWSALTPVGLFPAACAGIDVVGLLRGARQQRDHFLRTPARGNDVLKFVGVHYLAYIKQQRNVTVLMSYAARLDQFGYWFRQLWAESLGKRHSRTGRTVEVGLTPVAAQGATDQHSQVQLYNEGPNDKLITFIRFSEPRVDYIVPRPYPDLTDVAYYGGRKFGEILSAEQRATAQALAKSGKPNGTLTIPSIDGESVGALMMFFMLATSVLAELFNIDAYDQPGVEAGKQAMIKLLKRK